MAAMDGPLHAVSAPAVTTNDLATTSVPPRLARWFDVRPSSRWSLSARLAQCCVVYDPARADSVASMVRSVVQGVQSETDVLARLITRHHGSLARNDLLAREFHFTLQNAALRRWLRDVSPDAVSDPTASPLDSLRSGVVLCRIVGARYTELPADGPDRTESALANIDNLVRWCRRHAGLPALTIDGPQLLRGDADDRIIGSLLEVAARLSMEGVVMAPPPLCVVHSSFGEGVRAAYRPEGDVDIAVATLQSLLSALSQVIELRSMQDWQLSVSRGHSAKPAHVVSLCLLEGYLVVHHGGLWQLAEAFLADCIRRWEEGFVWHFPKPTPAVASQPGRPPQRPATPPAQAGSDPRAAVSFDAGVTDSAGSDCPFFGTSRHQSEHFVEDDPADLEFIAERPKYPRCTVRVKLSSVDCEIGRGRYGVVYRGLVTGSLRTVAVKVIARCTVSRLEEEANILASTAHRHIVECLGVMTCGEQLRVVMEFASGGTLRDLVDQYHPLPTTQALRLLGEIGSALAYLHDFGITHCDVKPENVLMRHDGSAALTDFGLARVARTTDDSDVHGTLLYCCAECFCDGQAKPPRDVYAFACLAVFILTGTLPWAHVELSHDAMVFIATATEQGTVPFDLSTLHEVGSVPGGAILAALLLRCFGGAPEARPPMSELCDELARIRAVA